jgi:HEAT repeat protein
MVSTTLVLVAIVIEVAALIVGLGLLVGHGAWVAERRRRLAPRVASARAAIISGLVERSGKELEGCLLDGLSRAERLRLLGDIGPTLGGAQRVELRELGRRAGLLDRASRDCRSRRWKRRLRGARVFTLLGSGSEVMPRLLEDSRPEVRSEAAVWAADHPDATVVGRLLQLLGDEATLCRFAVKDSLLRLGPAAISPLSSFLSTASGDQAVAGLEVARDLRDPGLAETAYGMLHSDRAAIRCRAAEVVAGAGGDRSARALIAAIDDPAPEVRAAAADGLGWGHHWMAAGPLAGALRDDSWDVRRAAGLALRRLGPAGELMLRRMENDEDAFAGDMARLMLELPGAPT